MVIGKNQYGRWIQLICLNKESKMFLNENIKRLRKAKGVSLKVMAEGVGVTPGYICELESGDRANPTYNYLVKLAAYFQISISSLMGENEVCAQDVRIASLLGKLREATPEAVDLVADILQTLVKHLQIEDCGFNQRVSKKSEQPKLVNNGHVRQLIAAPIGMFHTVGDPDSICFKTAGFIEDFEGKRVKAFDSEGEVFKGGNHRMVQPLRMQWNAQADKCDEYTHGGG